MSGLAHDAACDGHYSAWSPLPDACLEVIDTDRPHQTDTPHVVAPGHAQLESALAAVALGGKVGASPSERAAHVLFFENAYKLGVASGVDLQLLFKHAEYIPDTQKLVAPGPYTLRAKVNVVHGEGAVPAITLVPVVSVPVVSLQPFRAAALVFLGWELGEHVELETNIGAYASTKPKPSVELVLASALTWTIVGNFRVFGEAYATGETVSLGTGAILAVTRDVQLDVGSYIGLLGDIAAVTPFVGFSIRR